MWASKSAHLALTLTHSQRERGLMGLALIWDERYPTMKLPEYLAMLPAPSVEVIS